MGTVGTAFVGTFILLVGILLGCSSMTMAERFGMLPGTCSVNMEAIPEMKDRGMIR